MEIEIDGRYAVQEDEWCRECHKEAYQPQIFSLKDAQPIDPDRMHFADRAGTVLLCAACARKMASKYSHKALKLNAELYVTKQQKKQVYEERNRLVAVLSKLWPAHLMMHPASDTQWDPEWRHIVNIETPNGQCSWHIHDSELPLFAHLAFAPNDWDGHTQAQKYERLEKVRQVMPRYLFCGCFGECKGHNTEASAKYDANSYLGGPPQTDQSSNRR